VDELSDTKIRNATQADKEYAIADGQGLSVVVRPNGTKLWLFRYRFGGKRKNMSFGTFPGVGLKAARDKRHDAEKLLDQGQDPAVVREAKRQEDEKLKHTFRAVGEEWVTAKLEKENEAKSTIKRERWNLAQLNREIGDRGGADHYVREVPARATVGLRGVSATKSAEFVDNANAESMNVPSVSKPRLRQSNYISVLPLLACNRSSRPTHPRCRPASFRRSFLPSHFIGLRGSNACSLRRSRSAVQLNVGKPSGIQRRPRNDTKAYGSS